MGCGSIQAELSLLLSASLKGPKYQPRVSLPWLPATVESFTTRLQDKHRTIWLRKMKFSMVKLIFLWAPREAGFVM